MKLCHATFAALAICLALTSGLFAQASSGQRYALLIGVNDYTYFNQLRYCDNDMQALKAAMLKSGFKEENLTLMHGGSTRSDLLPFRNNIVEQLKLLLQGVQAEDLVIVAFSGHGVNLDEHDYLCAADSKLDAPAETMIDAKIVGDLLRASRARQKLVIVDACRDDPLRPGTKGLGQFSSLRSLGGGKGFVELRSCKSSQVSVEDGDLKHGVFMNFVIKGLLGDADFDADRKVDLLELYKYAESKTWNHVRNTRSMLQQPTLVTPDDEELEGNPVLAVLSGRAAVSQRSNPVPHKATLDRPSIAPRSFESSLLDQGTKLLEEGKTTEAVARFEELLNNGNDSATLDAARIKLAYAYLLLDTPRNLAKSLELRRQAGEDTVRVYVRSDRAPLKLGDRELRQLSKRQIVGIDKVSGDWYRVASIDDEALEPQQVGYLHKSAFEPSKQSNTGSNNVESGWEGWGGHGWGGHGWGGHGWGGHGWGGWGW